MKKTFGLVLIIAAVAVLVFISLQKPGETPSAGKPVIAASFYPLAFISEQIAGDDATVFSITPSGIEPHDYEPTAQEVATVLTADLFVFNGAGLDPWAHRLEADLERNNVSFIEAAELVELLAGEDHGHEHDHEDEHEVPTFDDGITDDHDHGHDHEGEFDPHVWLDPNILNQIAAQIAEQIALIDPAHAAVYAERYDALSARLNALDASYRTGLTTCTNRNFITSHAAFGYLAKAYNLIQTPIAGLSPEAEPSVKELAEVTSFAKKNGVKYIFFESLISPKLAQTIASEVGAQTLVLNPLEGLTADEMAAGKTYFTEMEQNLTNLRTALSCK